MIADFVVDFHAHLIPGIDDGAQNLDDSILLIRGLENLGFSKIIFTPHISQTYPNTRDSILTCFDRFMNDILFEFPGLEFGIGAEHMLDLHFLSILKNKKIIPFFKQYILVELGYKQPPVQLHEMIFEIQMAGFIPVIAHPERYLYFADHFENYFKLKDWGCLFQMNLGSLSGYYGAPMLDLSHRLIHENIIDFLASDLHNARQLNLIRQLTDNPEFSKLLATHKPFLNASLFA
jgi:protein-tyrosine phosphatase